MKLDRDKTCQTTDEPRHSLKGEPGGHEGGGGGGWDGVEGHSQLKKPGGDARPLV